MKSENSSSTFRFYGVTCESAFGQSRDGSIPEAGAALDPPPPTLLLRFSISCNEHSLLLNQRSHSRHLHLHCNSGAKFSLAHFTLSLFLSPAHAVIHTHTHTHADFSPACYPARMRSLCLYDSLQRAVGILTMMGLQLLFMHPPCQPFTL